MKGAAVRDHDAAAQYHARIPRIATARTGRRHGLGQDPSIRFIWPLVHAPFPWSGPGRAWRTGRDFPPAGDGICVPRPWRGPPPGQRLVPRTREALTSNAGSRRPAPRPGVGSGDLHRQVGWRAAEHVG
jgi:hypothetical protein